jgi:hypothetical protein
MLASCMVVKAEVAEPMAWNAAFEGAKIVTSFRELTAETRDVCVRAPVRAVSCESRAELEGERGIVRTESIMWITPPVNMTSYFVSAQITCKLHTSQVEGKTYRSGDLAHLLQTAHDFNGLTAQHTHDNLASCDVGVGRVCEQRWHELCCGCEGS